MASPTPTLARLHLRGPTDYGAVHALQRRLVDARIRGQGSDVVLLLEHADVLTVGRARGAGANVIDAGPVPVVAVERGGDVTWHGPGQLVAYPIVALDEDRRDLHLHLRALEDAVIEVLATLGLEGVRDPRNTGVWLEDPDGLVRKVASVGIACRRWVTWHGLALNVDPSRDVWARIRPCGFDPDTMTSVARHRKVDLDDLVAPLGAALARRLGRHAGPVVEVDDPAAVIGAGMTQAATSDADAGLTFREQISALDRTYWVANTMEMVERFAYYGLRTVLPIYMVLSVAQGGPEFDHVQKGQILAWWASIQSFVPIFTGGYADRYGYKLTVAAAIGIKVVGYLVMGFAIPIAVMVGGDAAHVPGNHFVYWTFLAGATCLAFGTAVFKPGLQGIIAIRLSGKNASLGWALFYALVNVGGFLGPYLASYMRMLEWRWVFVSCAVLICVNYGLLLLFSEPDKGDLPAETRSFWRVLWDSLVGICEPRLMAFLVVFSGFWMMFYQIFDLLPNFITDWVDSGSIVRSIVTPIFGLFGSSPPAVWMGQLPAEQMGNVNAGLIAVFAFGVGYVTGKVRSMTAMIVGIVISAIAIAGFSVSQDGWWVIAMIAIFSLGEMCASPTKLRYLANIAPAGRKGLYLGYANATVGIGWTIGSLVSGAMYQAGGDKVVLARRYLIDELGRDPAEIAAIAKDDVMGALGSATGETGRAAIDLLWRTYNPGEIWLWFAVVGLVSMFGLVVFDRITRRASENESAQLVALAMAVSGVTYGVGWTVGFGGSPIVNGLGWALAFGAPMTAWLGLRRYAPRWVPA